MNKRDWFDIASLIVVSATLFFVALYTVLTGYLAWIARDTARRQLRAYVVVGQDGNFNIEPQRLTSAFPIRNVGQTPAQGVHYAARLEILNYPVTDDPFVQYPIDIASGAQQTQTVLAPQTSINGRGRLQGDWTQEGVAQVLAHSTRRLHCFGLIEYRDIFGVRRKT